MTDLKKVIAVTGPTATGKTALAVNLACRLNGEIVSVDSRQVYRRMDLGTGKDIEEYSCGTTPVPYHLIDIADPQEEYHLARFLRDAFAAVGDIASRGKVPVLCGGSAMYLDALLRGYRLPGGALPHLSGGAREKQNRNGADSFTPPFALDALVIGVYYPRETVRRRIEERLDARFAAGMVDEVKALHDSGVSFEKLEFFGLEYREIAGFLQGRSDFAAMRGTLLNKIRQFAKRQDIFFRKMEREGTVIHWLPGGDISEAETLCRKFLAGEPLPAPAVRLCDTFYGKKSS